MLDRDQLIKSINKPYNVSRNNFLKTIPITIIGTPYQAGLNKRILHHKASLFYCEEEGNLTESTIMLGSYNWTYGGANYNFESCISVDNPGRLFGQLHGQFVALKSTEPSSLLAGDVDAHVREYPTGTDWTQDPLIQSSIHSSSTSSSKIGVSEESSRKKSRADAGGGGVIHAGSSIDVAEAEWIKLENWSVNHKEDGTNSYSRKIRGITVTVFHKFGKWKYGYQADFGRNCNSYQDAMLDAYHKIIK